MVSYYVGTGDDEHAVDHPPIFACREHRSLLTFSLRFIQELLAHGQDVMPGNPEEVALAYLREAAPAFRLPDFLMPPKMILFNPQNLRGPSALPYTVARVDNRFFGIPARYLTPDRFEGCEVCQALPPPPPPAGSPAPAAAPPPAVRRRPTPRPAPAGVRRPPPHPGSGRAHRPPPSDLGRAAPPLRRPPPGPPPRPAPPR